MGDKATEGDDGGEGRTVAPHFLAFTTRTMKSGFKKKQNKNTKKQQ